MGWSFLIFVIFIVCTMIELFFQWFFLSRLIFYKPKSKTSKQEPVSVVICARNEYSNLKKNIPKILEQKYHDYEVVLVDDRSTDGTRRLLKEYKKKYSHLNVIQLNNNVNFFKGKKFPLSIGIKSAKHDNLLFTDADCQPLSPYWIHNMQKNFSKENEIILGYGGYKKEKGFLNSLIRYNTLTVAMNYFSYALAGLPYMGVGRNLAYKKKLFYKAAGFISHYKLESGDDDLFVNQMANNKNTAIEISRDSFTYSEPEKSFKNWFFQKKRHFSTGRHYKNKHKFLLGLFGISNFAFYVTLIIILLLTDFWLWGIILLSVRTIGLIINYYYSAKKFDENILFLYSPIYDLIFSILNPVIYVSGFLYKKNKWK